VFLLFIVGVSFIQAHHHSKGSRISQIQTNIRAGQGLGCGSCVCVWFTLPGGVPGSQVIEQIHQSPKGFNQ